MNCLPLETGCAPSHRLRLEVRCSFEPRAEKYRKIVVAGELDVSSVFAESQDKRIARCVFGRGGNPPALCSRGDGGVFKRAPERAELRHRHGRRWITGVTGQAGDDRDCKIVQCDVC